MKLREGRRFFLDGLLGGVDEAADGLEAAEHRPHPLEDAVEEAAGLVDGGVEALFEGLQLAPPRLGLDLEGVVVEVGEDGVGLLDEFLGLLVVAFLGEALRLVDEADVLGVGFQPFLAPGLVLLQLGDLRLAEAAIEVVVEVHQDVADLDVVDRIVRMEEGGGGVDLGTEVRFLPPAPGGEEAAG